MNIRIDELNIKNFVGIGSGNIEVNPNNPNDIVNVIGIFGANGTGKTGTLNVIKVIQKLLKGEDIPINLTDIKNDTTITVKFTFSSFEETFSIFYSVKYNRKEIISEHLYKDKELLLGYCNGTYTGKLIKELPPSFNSMVKTDKTKLTSYLFNTFVLVYSEMIDFDKFNYMIMLNSFAKNKMLFIDAEEVYNGRLVVNIGKLVGTSDEFFNLIKPLSLERESVELIRASFIKINPLLKEFVNRRLELVKVSEGMYMVGVYNQDKFVLMEFESLGIKRLILYMYSFMLLRNDRSICLCIDEIDSGIFEPLLRELVLSIKTVYAGQLWFTAHNFELVGALNSNDVIFTTLDSKDRFMRLDTVEVLHDIYEKIGEGFYGNFDEAEFDYLMRGSHV